ncbi:hypothetical protein BKA70DRAFT_48534 [Coprinopsis sp. MPI-PUGE-AT-0042]|nr:hypothetical protein BKA70DRAFT_48534 [Coprinopsis sp. MPI-PUGE-AT-0042]
MGSPYSVSSPGGGGGSGGGDVTPTQQSLQSHFQSPLDGPFPPQQSAQHPLHMAPPTYATHTLARLVPPTPPSFAMEFGQVLQVISTAGHRDLKSKTRVVSMRKGTSVGANASGNDGDKGKVGKIDEAEAEDEFDMLEGVDDGSVREREAAAREGEENVQDGKSATAGRGDTGAGGSIERRKSAGNEEWDLVEGDDDDDF